MQREVIKCFAVWGWLFFQKTLFDEFRYSLRNLGRPVPNAGIEHPPLKDAVDRVLCTRLPGQIVENFWRWRRKSWVGKHTLEELSRL